MSELKTLQTLLAEKQKRIKEIEARIASIEGTDRPEAEPIKAWVATDKNGLIFIYKHKPNKEGVVLLSVVEYDELSENLPFPALSWDGTPVEIEITIKKV